MEWSLIVGALIELALGTQARSLRAAAARRVGKVLRNAADSVDLLGFRHASARTVSPIARTMAPLLLGVGVRQLAPINCSLAPSGVVRAQAPHDPQHDVHPHHLQPQHHPTFVRTPRRERSVCAAEVAELWPKARRKPVVLSE